jgi:hypothetical protein
VSGSESLPGTGIASGDVTSKGNITIKGRLPDNSTFSAATFLSKTGKTSFFLYRKGGSTLVSTLQFPQGSEMAAVAGEFIWRRKTSANDVLTEFAHTVLGSRYVRPVLFADLLPPITAATGGLLALDPGPEHSLPPQPFIFNPKGSAVFALPSPGLQLSTNLTTGLFTGTFRFPNSKANIPFHGAFLPSAGIAEGYYRATSGTPSGTLHLRSPP